MLEKADQRCRVAILLMASTGMRVGAIPLLRIRNLERIEKYSLYKVTVYENEVIISNCDSYLEKHFQRPFLRC